MGTEDQCQGHLLSWKELRLNLVHPQGSVTPTFRGHFAGGVDKSGRQEWRALRLNREWETYWQGVEQEAA